MANLRHLDISRNRLSLQQLVNLVDLIEGPPHTSLEVLKIQNQDPDGEFVDPDLKHVYELEQIRLL